MITGGRQIMSILGFSFALAVFLTTSVWAQEEIAPAATTPTVEAVSATVDVVETTSPAAEAVNATAEPVEEVAPPAVPASIPAKAAEPFSLDEMDAPAASPETPSATGTILKLFAIMLLLFALLAAGLIGFQRLSRRGLQFGNANRPLKVMDKLSLGPKHSICLVNTCGRYVVLGLCEKEINVLMEVTPTDPSEEKTFLATLQDSAKSPLSPK